MLNLDFSLDIKRQYWINWFLVPLLLAHKFLELGIYDMFALLSLIIHGGTIFASLLLVFFVTFTRRLHLFELYALIYIFFILTIAVLMGTDIKTYVLYNAVDLLLTLFLFIYNREENMIQFLKICTVTACIYIYIGDIQMILDPQWLIESKEHFEGYLLGGNYNQIGVRMILTILLTLITRDYGKWWRINSNILIINSILVEAAVGSMTSLSCIVMFVIYICITNIQFKRLATILLFSYVVFFQIFICFNGNDLYNNEYAVYFIQDVLGKDMTFTGRTYLWSAATLLFWESPIWGYGAITQNWYFEHLSALGLGTHNYVYEELLRGGIIGFSIFVFIGLYAVRRCATCDKSNKIIRENMLFGLSTLLFMQTMEAYPTFYIFFIFNLLYNFSHSQIEPTSIQNINECSKTKLYESD